MFAYHLGKKYRRQSWLLLALVTPLLITSISFGAEKLLIEVGAAKIRKSLLALPKLSYFGSSRSQANVRIGQEIYSTLKNDFDVSGYFKFIPPDAFLAAPSKTGLKPKSISSNGFKFENWTAIGTDFLIRIGYRVFKSTVNVEAFLYYVPKSQLVFGKNYKSTTRTIRKLAHTFANDVIESLTGKKGIFNTKIVYSKALVKNGRPGYKEIYISDWDGKNLSQVTRHQSIAISPCWSPDGKQLLYTAFAYHKKAKSRNADLFKYDIRSKRRWVISFRKGINSGGTFYPNGKNIMLSLSRGSGHPDLYRINTKGNALKRLTRGPGGAMNVEAAISPNGKQIAFSSDRSGKPMIYTMSINGKNVKRRIFQGRYNASPAWSPDGKRIAFAGYDAGHFDIFTMNRNGSNLIRLTTARKVNGKHSNNEDPHYSPDGRYLIFVSDRTGTNQLYIINSDGNNERRITFDKHHYEKPKWSPYLAK